ncbi:MAG TPA: acyl-CoA-binding protein [Flavobacteriia bacterium]|nr:acyl-CoA-binding protein [Flavobacteriia bacterium]
MDKIDEKFEKAFKIASEMTQKLPPDVMLRFYAFYKIATRSSSMHMPSGDNVIRNGFKLNALVQFKDVSKEEAKKEYIKLVEKYNNLKI